MILRILLAVYFFAFTIVFVACQNNTKPDALQDTLPYTQWDLVSATTHQANTLTVPGGALVLVFESDRFVIRSGCNDPAGFYDVNDETFEVIMIESTSMDCTDTLGPEVMQAEQLVFTAFTNLESITIEEGDLLHVRYLDGELLFHPFQS